jgi:uncharacterized membrane protein YfcA
MNSLVGLVILFLAGIAAGAINSVAGGGTLISFPSLVAFGESEIVSNATNTMAMWPGALSSALGYRKDTPIDRNLLTLLLVPSLIGGLLGAVILVDTPEQTFDRLVPFLVLFATVLFAARNTIARRFTKTHQVGDVTLVGRLWGFFFQLFVATYGGYFGAGIGILMLGSFSLMGLRDINEMNAIKTSLGTLINGTAFIFFAIKGLVAWPLALLMSVGTIIGGYGGARFATRVDPRIIHFSIIVIGLIVSVWLFIK